MKKGKKIKILFTGGGSGGHIFPIIAIVREIRKLPSEQKKNKEIDFSYLGPKDNFADILLSQENIKVRHVSAGKIRRYVNAKSILNNFIDLVFKIPIGLLQAFIYIFILAPDVIFSKGGFGSLPAVIAGWLLGVPIFLQESDVVPGLANRILGRFSTEIFVSFPKTPYFTKRMILTGNPIRREILNISEQEAKQFFKITGKKPVVFIMGGSQGSQRINDEILEVLAELVEHFEIIHQCGDKNIKQVKAEAKVVIPEYLLKYYHAFGFLKEQELKKAYAASDLVVSRAGSGSIFEIAAWLKPSILIPLSESAQNHQVENAYAYSKKGATIVLEEKNFTSRFFLEKLKNLFSHSEQLEKMKIAAKEFSKPMAAKIIAGYMMGYLTKS
ncbi:MAG: undecaprenyldiphospho-muramoylpentapeptide beta-N-acetylglucosaminyltransferase [Patescibacteria group bacterium]|nr:undecaprenyldiphospho-muramoylpentapeptide beta-N-acetylglucosaminyltransferase [Patescibacteria group bacterium]